MSQPPAKLQALLDTLSLLEDRNDRIQFLIDLAERFREVPESVATRPFEESHRVPHCESEAFAWAEPRGDGTLDFYFAVENPQGISAKAMAAILGDTLSGAPLEEVLAVSGDLPFTIFGRELSMGKSMGLTSLLGRLQAEARRHLRAAPDGSR
jgi:cysteine desulfuration protein SufE